MKRALKDDLPQQAKNDFYNGRTSQP